MTTATKERTLPTEPGGAPPPAPLVVRAEALPAVPSVDWLKKTLSPGQIETLCKTVAPPDATEDELAAFFWSARRRGLDPFLRQVHLVKRRRRVQKDGQWGYETYAVHQTGIDGFRVIGNRVEGKVDGKDCRLLAGVKRGPLKDEKGDLAGGWAEIYRHDWTAPARVEVLFAEYVQTDDKGYATGLWKTKPQTMIEKVAEAAAWRMAFPEDLGDLYVHEEMDNAEHIRPLNRDEKEPTSSATAPPVEGIVEGEIVRPANNGAGLFDEEAPAPNSDPRAAIISEIMKALAGFEPRPTDSQWARITGFFTGASRPMQAEAFVKVDPASLTDLRDFLKGMHAGDGAVLVKWKTEVSKWTP